VADFSAAVTATAADKTSYAVISVQNHYSVIIAFIKHSH